MAHIVSGNVVSPGFSMVNSDAIMTLASGLTCLAGDVMAVDMTKVRDATNGAHVFYELRNVVAGDFGTGSGAANAQAYLCVCLEAQATAAGNVRVRFMGEVDALVEDTALAIGTKLTVKASGSRALDTMATSVGTGTRAVAVLKQASTAANQIRRVDFDGLNGVIASGNVVTNTT